MSTQTPSIEQEYNDLPLGTNRPSFSKFGNASLDSIHQLCGELKLTALQRIDVEDVWARHPSRLAAPGFKASLIQYTLTVPELIFPENSSNETKSNHCSNIFSDPSVVDWFTKNIVTPLEWSLTHPHDAPPDSSRLLMEYQSQFNQKGFKLWDINNSHYATVRINLVNEKNPHHTAIISGRADYIVTKIGVSAPEFLSKALCVIQKQSGGKPDEETEHQLEAYLFLLMNTQGLKYLTGLVIYDDGRCRAYKAIRDPFPPYGCVYYSNDTFNIAYIVDVIDKILNELE